MFQRFHIVESWTPLLHVLAQQVGVPNRTLLWTGNFPLFQLFAIPDLLSLRSHCRHHCYLRHPSVLQLPPFLLDAPQKLESKKAKQTGAGWWKSFPGTDLPLKCAFRVAVLSLVKFETTAIDFDKQEILFTPPQKRAFALLSGSLFRHQHWWPCWFALFNDIGSICLLSSGCNNFSAIADPSESIVIPQYSNVIPNTGEWRGSIWNTSMYIEWTNPSFLSFCSISKACQPHAQTQHEDELFQPKPFCLSMISVFYLCRLLFTWLKPHGSHLSDVRRKNHRKEAALGTLVFCFFFLFQPKKGKIFILMAKSANCLSQIQTLTKKSPGHPGLQACFEAYTPLAFVHSWVNGSVCPA